MITAHRIAGADYAALFPHPLHVYNSATFAAINSHKCDAVHYLVLRDEKGRHRFGVILGERDGMLRTPFSAPFGGIEENGVQRIGRWLEAIEALRAYAGGDRRVRVTLPPPPYDNTSSTIAKQHLALLSMGARTLFTDYNYHYPLLSFPPDYPAGLRRNTRQAINASLRHDMTFTHITEPTDDDIRTLHHVIDLNHRELGHPFHMTAADYMATRPAVEMDFFRVDHPGHQGPVAAAIIYRSSAGVAQPTGWGDLPSMRHLGAMNFLACNTLRHYASQPDIATFDLGPSSSEGVPSPGLADFKEGLGCRVTLKPTLIL